MAQQALAYSIWTQDGDHGSEQLRVIRPRRARTSARRRPQPAPEDRCRAPQIAAEVPRALSGGDKLHYVPVTVRIWDGSPALPSAKNAKVSPGEAARRVAARLASKPPLATPSAADSEASCFEHSPVPPSEPSSSAFTPVPAAPRGDRVTTASPEPLKRPDRHETPPRPRVARANYFRPLTSADIAGCPF
eukprot:TRINITY_DN51048_c0_g1_i1.p1 TRINITY_DN51048_c0_g1~~TRINITY_DN51048_c0_g1_i1.p1  ORF type:complete len:190 (+),score=21.53 TRINITY_DN51048_c0_g1_i1:77-646(+)